MQDLSQRIQSLSAEQRARLAQRVGLGKFPAVPPASSNQNLRLAAYVLLKDGSATDRNELRQYVRQRLPDYMVPSDFFLLEAFPYTPNGKLDRRALSKLEIAAEEEFFADAIAEPRTRKEKIIAAIWREVLGIDVIGIDEGFFELGGDSLMGIRVIARARQEGLALTPRQLFTEQTIARLAEAAAPIADQRQEAVPAGGPVPLTPIQHWLIEQNLQNPAQWNQAGWFKVTTPLDHERYNKALAHVTKHHPMLQARYQMLDDGWQQLVISDEQPENLIIISLVGCEPQVQDAEMIALANQYHAQLDLTHGPVMLSILFDLGPERGSRLLLIVHHLVIDTASWPILIADIEGAYKQLAAGENVSLPATKTSYAQWAHFLHRYADSPAMRQEADYWLSAVDESTPPLWQDADDLANTVDESDAVVLSLNPEYTSLIQRDVHKAYHTRIEDILLTALGRTFSGWTDNSSILLTLERHGREPINSAIDVSQTVGWFTSFFPINLVTEPDDEYGDLLRLKEQLRNVPQKGIGYTILRYLGNDEIKHQLAQQTKPQVLFNYLGQVSQRAQPGSLLQPLAIDAGQVVSPQNSRVHLIDINSWIADGRLHVKWQYSMNHFQHSAVERAANLYISELERIIDHCLGVDREHHTPSDFPLADLEQNDLDSLSDLLAELE
ncbi:MAG: condensation domain-containing protein [Candidatus Promineifilaceae bacterium]|nr:condensation domain-containing protein [Candidatus Promineifilaceae bacterium]